MVTIHYLDSAISKWRGISSTWFFKKQENPRANIILNGRKDNVFPQNQKQGKGIFSQHSYSISYKKS